MTNIRSGLDKTVAAGLAVALAALLAGCASTGGLATSARKLDAASLQAAASLGPASLSAAAWPTEAWWRRYGDPQLDALVAEALAHSPNLRLAQARIRQAEAFAGAAQAAAGPQLGAGVRSNRVVLSPNPGPPARTISAGRSSQRSVSVFGSICAHSSPPRSP